MYCVDFQGAFALILNLHSKDNGCEKRPVWMPSHVQRQSVLIDWNFGCFLIQKLRILPVNLPKQSLRLIQSKNFRVLSSDVVHAVLYNFPDWESHLSQTLLSALPSCEPIYDPTSNNIWKSVWASGSTWVSSHYRVTASCEKLKHTQLRQGLDLQVMLQSCSDRKQAVLQETACKSLLYWVSWCTLRSARHSKQCRAYLAAGLKNWNNVRA